MTPKDQIANLINQSTKEVMDEIVIQFGYGEDLPQIVAERIERKVKAVTAKAITKSFNIIGSTWGKV